MGVLFTLTPAIKAITQQALDDLITELAKDCKLIYPATNVQCGCQGNYWVTGGKIPLSESACPLCSGTGFKAEQTTEIIQMTVALQPAHFWKKFPSNIEVPTGTIQTKTNVIQNVIKIKQAREMQLQPELDGFVRQRYKLDGEPIDVSSIIQGRYFIMQWLRIQ